MKISLMFVVDHHPSKSSSVEQLYEQVMEQTCWRRRWAFTRPSSPSITSMNTAWCRNLLQ
jgi:hypothetical protein